MIVSHPKRKSFFSCASVAVLLAVCVALGSVAFTETASAQKLGNLFEKHAKTAAPSTPAPTPATPEPAAPAAPTPAPAESAAPAAVAEGLKGKLAAIPASYEFSVGDVVEDAASRSATLKQVAFTVPQGEARCAITLESVVWEGLSFSEESGKLFLLADKMTVTGAKTSGKDFESTSAHFVVTGIKADLETAATAWGNYIFSSAIGFEVMGDAVLQKASAPERPEITPEIPFFFTGWLSQGDSYSIKNGEDVTKGFLGSVEIKDYSEKSIGPVRTKDIRAEFNGRKFLTIAEAGANKSSSPQALEMAEASDGLNPFSSDVEVEGLFVKNLMLSVDIPNSEPSEITMAKLDFDMRVADKDPRITISVDQLAMAKKLLFSKGEDFGIAPMLSEVESLIPETLILGFKTAVAMAPSAEGRQTATISPLALSIEKLGSLTLSAVLEGTVDAWMEAGLRSLDLSVTDLGLSEIVFTLTKDSPEATAAAARQEIRQGISAMAGGMPGSLGKLGTDLSDFLKEPGVTMTVKMAPPEPLTAVMMDSVMAEPERLGLSSAVERK